MPIVKAQIALRTADQLPENFITNTLYFDIPDTPNLLPDINLLSGNLITYYTAMQSLFSPLLSVSNHGIKYYDLSDPQPRPPVAAASFNLALTAGSAVLPPEVAICQSFAADPEAGVSPARLRGRNFIGPFKSSSIDVNTGRVVAATRTIMVTAAQNLKNDCATDLVPWLVVHGANTATPSGKAVVRGWVDDEFDTMRSRGRKPTTRSIWAS